MHAIIQSSEEAFVDLSSSPKIWIQTELTKITLWSMVGSCEQNNESSGSTTDRKYEGEWILSPQKDLYFTELIPNIKY